MNKKEAADYLGVSTRAVERYTSKGKLTPDYEKGRTVPVPIYDPAQLDRLKREMSGAAPSPVRREKQANNDNGDSDKKSVAVAVRNGRGQDFAQLIAALETARAAQVPIADKPLLTRAEAQRLTGLSRAALKAAVEAGKLKETLIGRAYRIKRDDLDKFIKSL